MGKFLDWPYSFGFLIAFLDSVMGILGVLGALICGIFVYGLDREKDDKMNATSVIKAKLTFDYSDHVAGYGYGYMVALVELRNRKISHYNISDLYQFEHPSSGSDENEGANWLITLMTLLLVATVISGFYVGILKVPHAIMSVRPLRMALKILSLLIFLAFFWHVAPIFVVMYALMEFGVLLFQTDWTETIVFISLIAVLSISQIVYGVILFFGILKGHDILIKAWLIFKHQLTLPFLLLLPHFSFSYLPQTLVLSSFFWSIVFIIIHGLLTAIITMNLKEIYTQANQVGPQGREGVLQSFDVDNIFYKIGGLAIGVTIGVGVAALLPICFLRF